MMGFTGHKLKLLGMLVSGGMSLVAGGNVVALETTADVSKDDQRDTTELTEVVVTAQKRVERLQDVPITINVLSGHELDTSSFVSTKDALATVPGLATFTDNETGGTVLSLRGVSASGPFVSGSTPVAYYLDGAPVAFIRSAIVPDANVYDLQRIEVLSGPQGTLYGASALNGVVRILTNDADLNNVDFKSRAAVSSTDHGGENYDGAMAVNIPLVESLLAMRLVASTEHESGWINSPLGNHVNDVVIQNDRLKVNAAPTDTLSIGLSAWHSQYQAGGPPQGDPNYEMLDTFPQPDSNYFNDYIARVNNDFGAFSLSSTTSYLSYADSGADNFSAAGIIFGYFTWLRNRNISEELNLVSKDSGPWKWSAGVFYRDAKDNYYQNFGVSPPTFGDDFTDTSKSTAVYGELGRSFFDDQIEVSAGARYFHDDVESRENVPSQFALGPVANPLASVTSNATTPRAIVTWKPSQEFNAYLSYGQGFRSGIPQDYLVQAKYPAAAPDKLTNYELGVKGNLFDQRIAYTVALYYMHWTGVQQSIFAELPNGAALFVIENAGNASGPGADASFAVRPFKGLELNATVSWNNLTFDHTVYSGGSPIFLRDNRLDTSPPVTASGSIDYNFPLGRSGVRGQFEFSENFTGVLNTIYQLPGGPSNYPSNSVLIARAQFMVKPSEHWTVALFADNLANYNGTVAGQSPPSFEIRATPRTAGIRFDYHLR